MLQELLRQMNRIKSVREAYSGVSVSHYGDVRSRRNHSPKLHGWKRDPIILALRIRGENVDEQNQ